MAAVFYCFMHPQLSTIAALKKKGKKNLATHILAQFSRLALSLYHKVKHSVKSLFNCLILVYKRRPMAVYSTYRTNDEHFSVFLIQKGHSSKHHHLELQGNSHFDILS